MWPERANPVLEAITLSSLSPALCLLCADIVRYLVTKAIESTRDAGSGIVHSDNSSQGNQCYNQEILREPLASLVLEKVFQQSNHRHHGHLDWTFNLLHIADQGCPSLSRRRLTYLVDVFWSSKTGQLVPYNGRMFTLVAGSC